MNLLEVKKNKNKNIFFCSGAVFCSFFIHFCIFVLFYNYNNNKFLDNTPHPKKIVHLNIIHSQKNLNIMQQKNNQPQIIAVKKVKLETNSLPQKNKTINNQTNEQQVKSSMADVPLEPPIIYEKNLINNAVVSNPFGQLKLPKNVLGQNLFPKQYKVFFNLKTFNHSSKLFSVTNFIPIENNNQYLDKIIEKAFLTQLQGLDNNLVSQWLEIQFKKLYASENTENISHDNFFIVLEFQEPN